MLQPNLRTFSCIINDKHKLTSETNDSRGAITSPNIQQSGMILGLRPTNDRCRYFVTTSLIGGCKPWILPE